MQVAHLGVVPLLMSVILLTSCTPNGKSKIDIDLDEKGRDFVVVVENRAVGPLAIHDRLLGLGSDVPIKVEVASDGGAVIAACRHIDFVGTGSETIIPAGESRTVRVPVSAVSVTHCLKLGERYKIRARLVVDGVLVSQSPWAPFRASFG